MTIEEMQDKIKDLSQKVDLLIALVVKGEHNVAVPCVSSCAYTLFSWIDEWFTLYKASTLSDKGYKMRLSIEKHIKQNFENKSLQAITSADITCALNAIKSERMRQIVWSIYNQAFAKAVKLGYISENPMLNVDTVKHHYENGRALTISEQSVFLSAIVGNELEMLYRFYLLTGCRRAEALAVKWSDIQDGYIHIHGTKTRNSIRTLPLSTPLENLLKIMPRIDERLFPYTVGKVRKNFERLREHLPFDDFTIHDLRHTFATRCLEKGVSMKTVQKWLGHSKYDTTANIYSHITQQFEREEIAKISE